MSEYIFDRQGLAAYASIDLHDYLKVREVVNSRIKEQIVRCRDCRFCGKGQWGAETFPVCRRGIHVLHVSNDGFCAWGKRREA